jgi:t-SNARE complex subunit (syntaxin)
VSATVARGVAGASFAAVDAAAVIIIIIIIIIIVIVVVDRFRLNKW